MRKAAGYSSEENHRQNGPPVPNLPGHSVHFMHSAARPKGQSLRFVNGYAVTDEVVSGLNSVSLHNWGGDEDEITQPPTRTRIVGGRLVTTKQQASPPPYAQHDSTTQRGRDYESPKQASPYAQHESPKPAAVAHVQAHDQYAEPGSSTPTRGSTWATYNRKVLIFGGYFREEVINSPLESYRVRRVAIRYHLENDQVEVLEAREENSGLTHGVFLKRINAVKENGSPLRWNDLRVGSELRLYGRTYTLVAADAATRAFYEERGEEQVEDMPYPEGPFDKRRKAMEASKTRPPPQPFKGPPLPRDPRDLEGPRIDPRGPRALFDLYRLKRPAEVEARDNAILRFHCAWDNTAATFGEMLAFSLHYHVVDGTIEVREVARRNSGRDPFPLLLRRCRLPKTIPPVHGRPMSPGTRRMLALEYYDWRDLKLGASVNVYGRSLLLHDCDEATRSWLRANVPNITEEHLTPIHVEFEPEPLKRPQMPIPPHTGIGSEEDSLQNVLRLVPRPAPRPYAEYLDKGNQVLRFETAFAPLEPGKALAGPHDEERRFILSFHLLDGTISVWEPRRANSGMEQGTFLERTRVRNPATGQNYTETDLQIGAVLEIFGRGFQLLDADAFTLTYMERESRRFPCADYEKVLSKLSSWLSLYPEELPDRLRADMLAEDVQGTGYLTKYQLHAVLSALGSDLSPHEVLTLVRQLGADRLGLLVEQLLVALGLAPPPEEPEESLVEEEPPQPAALHPPVPFPAPGLQQQQPAAGFRQPQRMAAWAPHPAATSRGSSPSTNRGGFGGSPGGPASTAARVGFGGSPAGGGRGGLMGSPAVGGISGHRIQSASPIRVQSASPIRVQSASPIRVQSNSPLQLRVDGQGAATPRQNWAQPRESPDKAWGNSPAGKQQSEGGVPRPSALPTGMQQPPSLWQTTNMAIGGVGHTASFRRPQSGR